MTLWTPAEITTDLWLDAADASTITIATGVSVWADKSGNSNNVSQSTASAQPTILSAALNGLDVITFDGSNDNMYKTGGVLSNTRFSVFAVSRLKSSAPDKYWILGEWNSGVSPGTNEYLLHHGLDSTLKPGCTLEASSTTYFATSGTSNGTAYIISGAVHDGSNLRHYVDGALTATTAATVVKNQIAARAFIIGALATGYWSPISVAEVVIVSSALSTDWRQKIEGYLAWKWGLEANLPIGHPYQLSAPTIGTSILNYLGQLYRIGDPILVYLFQTYNLTTKQLQTLVQTYGLSLLVYITQLYGDPSQLRTQLVARYQGSPVVKTIFQQLYKSAPVARTLLNQGYSLNEVLTKVISQKYALTQTLDNFSFNQVYDIKSVYELKKLLNQQYVIYQDSIAITPVGSGTGTETATTTTLTIDGK